MTQSTTHIGRVRVRAPEALSTHVQLRLESQLVGADVRPPGLAPSQVLLVRQVSDPAPGGLPIDRPSPGVNREWERSVRDALLDCLHEAARPQNGWVPAGVNAVLFADEAEAWAAWSLAASSADPASQQPWWMKGLERLKRAATSGQAAVRVVSRVWASQPAMLPGLLTHLGKWDGLVATLKALSEDEAASLRGPMCAAFGIDPPAAIPDVPFADGALGAGQTPHRDDVSDRSYRGWTDRTEPASASGVGLPGAHIDEVSQRIEPVLRQVDVDAWADRLELLAVALTLYIGPPHVRSAPFRRRWRKWRAIANDRGRSLRTMTERPSKASQQTFEGRASEEVDAENGLSDTPGQEMRSEPESTDADSEDWTDPYTRTDLGGVLYLVNALAAFELPVSADKAPLGVSAGGWAVLEAVARSLLSEDDNRADRSDPLWRLLAQLDGRESNAPAEMHSAPRSKNGTDGDQTFRAPIRWIEEATSNDDRTAHWTVENGRLLLWIPRVGPVVDLPVSKHPERRAEEEWTRVPDAGGLTRVADASEMPVGSVPPGCGSTLGFWASRFVPFLEARVLSALDGSAATMKSFLQVPARIYSSATHVDVVLPLEAARIDVRRAGLDRSPGWWPAGGRVIQIHFRSAGTGSE